MTPAEIAARLERSVHRDEAGCWIWTGAVQSSGYSSIGIDGVSRYSRRTGLTAGDFTHGYSGYCNHGCRCDVCRSGAREYHQRAKALRSTPIT